jgi:hypothetical protein
MVSSASKDPVSASRDTAGDGWLPISEAPDHQPWYDSPRVLVYSKDTGVQPGKVYWYPGNLEPSGRAEGFNGDYNITHWRPMPSAPAAPSQDDKTV